MLVMEELLTNSTWYEIYFGILLFGIVCFFASFSLRVVSGFIFFFLVEIPVFVLYEGFRYLNNRMRKKDSGDGITT
jgi:general stress protein CsbA